MIAFTSWISISGTANVIPVTELFTPSPAILLINPALFQNCLKHINRDRYLSDTGRSFRLFMAFGADAPHRPTQKVVWLIGFADGRRKVKDALYYSVFKERAEAIEKAPSLSMPKS